MNFQFFEINDELFKKYLLGRIFNNNFISKANLFRKKNTVC